MGLDMYSEKGKRIPKKSFEEMKEIETKITTIEGYSGKNFEDNLEIFKKNNKVVGIVPIQAIVIYEIEKK